MFNEFYKLKKGSIKNLKGKVIVYAKILNPSSPENLKNPVNEMSKSGIIAAVGDFRTQHNLGDFLKKELGISLDDIEKNNNINIAGLPDNLDPSFVKKKLEDLKGFEELIPTPSKLEHFDNEQEILSRDEDIFYLGEFNKLSNANLAINSFPIMYQAIFREQVSEQINDEIEKLLSGVSEKIERTDHYLDDTKDIENKINKEFIPELIYNRSDKLECKKWVEKFRSYMAGFKYFNEVDKIIALATQNNADNKRSQKLLELYTQKISAFINEDYKKVGALKNEIEDMEKK